MSETPVNCKQCNRCKKTLAFDMFKLKSPQEYYKQCIRCNDKKKSIPSNSVEMRKIKYRENKESIALRHKTYRDNLPVINCECGSSVKSYKLIRHLKTKVHSTFLASGKTKEQQRQESAERAYVNRLLYMQEYNDRLDVKLRRDPDYLLKIEIRNDILYEASLMFKREEYDYWYNNNNSIYYHIYRMFCIAEYNYKFYDREPIEWIRFLGLYID